MKLSSSSSQNQDGKSSRRADMKKKMKKSRSIKFSDLDEALQSSSPPSRRCSSSSPLHVPTTAASASPQKKQPPLVRAYDSQMRKTDGSPNYMKPTSSSHAKKELFPVSHRNTHQSGSDSKNLARKSHSDSSKASRVSFSKSLSLVRSLTRTTSFKASRSCPRKSSRATALCAADMSAAPQRATCSSTLKDSKFPAYLMLNPGGTESEGTSVMNVCPYTYCSLNGHRRRHAALPPLKSFMAARRHVLKIQKSARVEALSPRRSKKARCNLKKESETETERSVFDAKASFDENGVDFFIGIYPKQVAPSIADIPITPKSEIDLEKEFEKSFDDIAIEVDTRGIFLQEEEAADGRNQPTWSSHEEISMGSYCSDDSCDGEEENMKDVEEMDCCDSKATKMELGEEQRIFGLGHEEEVGSSLFSEVESFSESSHDLSVTWLDEEDLLAEETVLQVANSEEGEIFEEQHGSVVEGTSGSTEIQETGYPSNDLGCDQSFLTAEVSLEYLTKEEDNGAENEEHVVDETGEDRFSIQENQVHMLVFQNTSCVSCGEEQNTSMSSKGAVRCKRLVVDDDDEMREFNPKEPNFLPLVPEPEPEKVDLRHQMIDERKDAEQWMIDSALRQVVTKLAPARKKKVALLVEAFETIMPIPKCETHHMRRNNSAFPHAGRIQACS